MNACPACGHEISTTPIRGWIGTPPPGWESGDPVPHVCPPKELWKPAAIDQGREPESDG